MQWGNDNFFSLVSFKFFYWWEKGKVGEKLVSSGFVTHFASMSSSAVSHNKTNGGRWGRQVEMILKVGEK